MSCAEDLTLSGDPVSVSLAEPRIGLTLSQAAPVVLTLGLAAGLGLALGNSGAQIQTTQPGPPGAQGLAGAGSDPVFTIRPDSTLSYDGADKLIRVDYADGTAKDLTYNGSDQLITVAGVNLSGDTVTKTLTYSGAQLVGVATVIT